MDLKKNMTDTQGDPDKEKSPTRQNQAVISQLVDKESPGLGREERSQLSKGF